ncbi:MAG: hypothetical protein GH155_04035 [Spirochaeta sp.]|nr:hypothetical protein [Spirochaeta sp.]
MKKLLYVLVLVVVGMAMLGCAGLPKTVQSQSRKGVVESEAWKKFDKSGDVKFLQVQTTVPKSDEGTGVLLDGSLGELLVEVQVQPGVEGTESVWSLKNKGPSTVWIVAAGGSESAFPISIDKDQAVELTTMLDKDRYTYLVVDNEGGGKTQLDLAAKCGGTDAKTTRGKNMTVIWF